MQFSLDPYNVWTIVGIIAVFVALIVINAKRRGDI
jgi:hypothetical protein